MLNVFAYARASDHSIIDGGVSPVAESIRGDEDEPNESEEVEVGPPGELMREVAADLNENRAAFEDAYASAVKGTVSVYIF